MIDGIVLQRTTLASAAQDPGEEGVHRGVLSRLGADALEVQEALHGGNVHRAGRLEGSGGVGCC